MRENAAAPPVQDDEILGRGVFSRKDKKLVANNRVPHKLFLAKSPPEKISTSRLDREPDGKMAELADLDGKDRGQTFYGWAEMSAEAARRMGRKAEASPTPRNHWHADIVLPDAAKEDLQLRKKHAFDLAARSVWRPRPD